MQRLILILFTLLMIFQTGQLTGQERKKSKESEKKGILEQFVEDFEEEDDEDEEEGSHWFFSIIDPIDIIHALVTRDGGPYPYNGVAASFTPDEHYPNGTLQVAGNYFAGASSLYGLVWRTNYYYDRFGFETSLITLVEDMPDQTNLLNFGGARLNWDVVANDQFRLGAQIGLQSIMSTRSRTGPALGFRLVGLPRKPFLITARSTVAFINDQQLTIFSATLGLMLKRVELFIGGQLFKSPSVTIDGFTAGLRFWL